MAVGSDSLKWLLSLMFGCAIQACVRCEADAEWELVPVALGEPHTLLCAYNCSEGFMRGTWRSRGEDLGCSSCHWTQLAFNKTGDLCILPLHTKQVMQNDTQLNYTCVSCQTDQPGVPCHTARQLQLKISTSLTATPPPPGTTRVHMPNDDAPGDGTNTASGALGLVKVLAAVAVATVLVLLSYLGLLGCRRRCAAGSEKTPAVRHDRSGMDKDYACVTFTSTDCQSDHEVAYADIMISVRGVSTPELRGLVGSMGAQGGCHDNLRAKWKEDSSPLQHAFRSADRLHVQPREVSRKLSSTSEYAVITYSTDADL